MYSHMTIGSNDLARSRRFYDALFGAVGAPPATENDGRLFYSHEGGLLVILKPIDGKPATAGNGTTFGFTMRSPEETVAWHKAGTENGGTAIENPPGIRETIAGKLFLAYLRDPDGNKLCGFCRSVAE